MAHVYIHDQESKVKYKVALRDVPVDNGALFSCGLWVRQDGFTHEMLLDLIKRGKAVQVSEQEALHAGCQSYCVLRGDLKCQW